MTAKEVLSELEALGNAGTKKVLAKHGAKDPFYGVKTGDLKKVQKKIKKDHALFLELFDSGISDAMYLAGLIADKEQISKDNLKK
jgi:3-methyladenine DNA glycosylase AlkD